ncbi:NUDIX hydrolase [Micrococcus lacusdianchii]|uniref:NUDIX hydrolase n=1 Tax=Micrococcus lacusdianchii TaxID=2915940 RepID=UPI0020040229
MCPAPPSEPAAAAAPPAPDGVFQTRAGSYALIVAEGAVLLSAWRGPQGIVWTLPGGGIELGESPEEACLREVEEETGHTCELTGLLGVTTGTVPAERRLRGEGVPLLTVQVLHTARLTGGTLRPETDGSSVDARWFRLDALDDVPLSAWVRRALELAGLPVPAEPSR